MTKPKDDLVVVEPEAVKCDNHPDVDAKNFTGDNAYSINLCDACTPRWFKVK